MLQIVEDPRRVEVWLAMADHFLDTETRHEIPLTAMRCVQAGLSRAEAADVWRHEVSPAVGWNLYDIAGEWAGWDRDWLVARIRQVREEPGGLRRVLRAAHIMNPVWISIGRCIDALLAVEEVADRERWLQAMSALARHYFDFCPAELRTLDESARRLIRSLYPEPFRFLMSCSLVLGEGFFAERRVRRALAELQAP